MLSLRQTCLDLAILFTPSLSGTNQCVNQGGTGGCKSSINASVAAAGAKHTVTVAHGTYAEDDGLGNPGLAHVVVNGFTVTNANFQGILVTKATDVTVRENHATGNERSLQPFHEGGPICPGIPPYFEAGEGFDCGEGIHLSGVTHSTVADNLVDHNSGGILISDHTGPNHDALIMGNTVQDNP